MAIIFIVTDSDWNEAGVCLLNYGCEKKSYLRSLRRFKDFQVYFENIQLQRAHTKRISYMLQLSLRPRDLYTVYACTYGLCMHGKRLLVLSLFIL